MFNNKNHTENRQKLFNIIRVVKHILPEKVPEDLSNNIFHLIYYFCNSIDGVAFFNVTNSFQLPTIKR